MDELDKTSALNVGGLDNNSIDITKQLLEEQDIDKVKDLTAAFNLNVQKRNAVRVLKMNGLLDKVTDQIIERFEKNPHNFSNEDLLKYMQATEAAIEKATKNVNLIEDTPAIQLMQNNQVNINIEQGLNRESRQKVTEAVQAILKNMQLETQAEELDD